MSPDRERRGWDRGWYPPSRPREVEGGLKARSTRGPIAKTWWSERFVAVLEGLRVGGRLERGRRYARKGQVLSLDVEAGTVRAEVQGSRARPYRVRIGITAFGKAEWARLEQALAGDAWYAAQLLAGQMPPDIEDVFDREELPLFPEAAHDLSMDCTCPDWEVPCKHLAATFYLLAEAFDDDPFTILAWRGRERDQLLANLRAARTDQSALVDSGPAAVPLEDCLATFYEQQADLPRPAPAGAGFHELLDQLPPVAIEVRGHRLKDLLAQAYPVPEP